MKQLHNVVALPTNESEKSWMLYRNTHNIWGHPIPYDERTFEFSDNPTYIRNRNLITNRSAATNARDKHQALHLYLTTNKEIKEGDYITVGDKVRKVVKDKGTLMYETDIARLYLTENCKKIVATTDPHLGIPKIPVSFAKSYAESNGSIREVLVDYIEFLEGDGDYMTIIQHDGSSCAAHRNNFPMLAVRKNGTVIISKAKTYSREEVKEQGLKFLKDLSLGDKKRYFEYEQKWLNWVDKNL